MNTPTLTSAGVGARATPPRLAPQIEHVARQLARLGYTLHSGGADGFDTFAEKGATKKRIFLPWAGFNGNASQLFSSGPKAFEIAKHFHPAWDRLGTHARVFMARNSYQVLGPDLATPVDFVWCWTPHGAVIGGTGQALRIAAAYEIPVFNLATDKDYSGLETWLAAAGFDLSELPTT